MNKIKLTLCASMCAATMAFPTTRTPPEASKASVSRASFEATPIAKAVAATTADRQLQLPIEDLGRLVYMGTKLPCVKEYESGTSRRALSCPAEDQCCSWSEFRSDQDGCVTSCTCTTTEERTGTRTVVDAAYPVKLRGVPIFKQYDAKARSGFQPIGCGSIALTQLAMYYGQWGWSNLLGGGSGRVNWEDTADDGADYLNTWVRNNASPTLMSQVQNGIEDLFTDAGYNADVTYVEVTDDAGEESDAFGRIKSSILQGRPVYVGFDINAGAGGGIGGGGDNLGFIDHYGLIVGFDDTGSQPKIDINMGWGDVDGTVDGTSVAEGVATYDWSVGRGKVFLWFVQLDASEKTTSGGSVIEACPLPAASSFYQPSSVTDSDGDSNPIGLTYASDASTPLLQTLIAGTDCALLGGEVTRIERYTYTYTHRTGWDCGAKYDLFEEWASGDGGDDLSLDTDVLDRQDPLP